MFYGYKKTENKLYLQICVLLLSLDYFVALCSYSSYRSDRMFYLHLYFVPHQVTSVGLALSNFFCFPYINNFARRLVFPKQYKKLFFLNAETFYLY